MKLIYALIFACRKYSHFYFIVKVISLQALT